MNQLTLEQLQRATADRGTLWGSPGLQFRGLELSGESIELLEAWSLLEAKVRDVAIHSGKTVEALKKVVRFQNGMAGGSDDLTKLKEELGDTVISCALLANELGLDLGEIVSAKFNETSRKYNFPQRLETECQTIQQSDKPMSGAEKLARRIAEAAFRHPCLRDDLADEKLLDDLKPYGYEDPHKVHRLVPQPVPLDVKRTILSTKVPTLDAVDRAPWEANPEQEWPGS